MGFAFVISSVLAAASATAGVSCPPIAGWEEVLADEKVRWVIVGELHGNNESPEIFADAVCLTAHSRAKVVVGVEQSAREQPAIDRFLASDGGEAARRQFLRSPMWNGAMQDGRASRASFRLFETLRRLRATGQIDSVVAFVPAHFTEQPSQAEYEMAMAELLQAAGGLDATVMALVGSIHALRGEVPWPPGYQAMATHLPSQATITLNVIGQGGESWNCLAEECGPHPQAPPPQSRPRGIELMADRTAPYSGVLHLGVTITASPPQQPASARSE